MHNWVIIVSRNDLVPNRQQTITCTNADLLELYHDLQNVDNMPAFKVFQ